jgi:ferredoxin
MEACPEVFRVEDDDTLTVLMDDVPEELRAKLQDAERLCPRQAIRIEG